MAANDDLDPGQMRQLIGIFRSEATEHVSRIAETLFALEEQEIDDPSEILVGAFREAHSLKGSSATLGFERASTLTHRLEDVFGVLKRRGRRVEENTIDQLLQALDVIREVVDTSEPGDEELSPDETGVLESLNQLVANLTPEADGPHPSTTEVRSAPGLGARPERDEAVQPENVTEGGEKVEAPAAWDMGRPEYQGERYIRVAEGKLDTVIAQIGEIFESNILVESAGISMRRTLLASTDLATSISHVSQKLRDAGLRDDVKRLTEKASHLALELDRAVRRFEKNERSMTKLIDATQESLRRIRLAPVSSAYVTVRRQVRELSRSTGKSVELHLGGGEYAIDRKILEAVEDPLTHLIRNAVDHGLEDVDGRLNAGKPPAGQLSVTARHLGDAVELTIADDGAGIDPEAIRRALLTQGRISADRAKELSRDQLLDTVFQAGFSTRQDVSSLSGRGVGLDVVKSKLEGLGGEVRMNTRPGEGTAITLRLPLSMSAVRCLSVKAADRSLAIPAANVEKVLILEAKDITVMGGSEVVRFRDHNVPLRPLSDVLGLSSDRQLRRHSPTRQVVVMRFGERQFAFYVDDVQEYTQIIVKPLGDLLERVPTVTGISLLSNGDLALVLNPGDLVRLAGGGVETGVRQPIFQLPESQKGVPLVLVVDDSIATRTLEKTLLESAGFMVLTATDGLNALEVLDSADCDLVVSDVQMPNMSGFELTQAIKSRPALAHLPVILVTTLGSNEDKAKGLACGADAYIVKKDLTQSELVATINQLL